MIYTKNIDIFENIDTEEKAYWLGMIMADGSITWQKTKAGISLYGIKLGLTDKEVMDKFKVFLGLGEETPYWVLNQPKCQPVYYLNITCHKIAQDLGKHGAVPHKTNRIKIPVLKDEFIRHFIRGYFDGDGCIYMKDVQRKDGSFRKEGWAIITSCSIKILKQIETICQQKKLIKSDRTYLRFPKTYKGKKHVPFFIITKRVNTVDFLNFLYKDAKVYMERKYKLYTEFIQAFSEQKKYNKKGKYFGVYFVSLNPIRPYRCNFIYNKQHYNLGCYATEIEAAEVYNKKIIELGLSKELLNVF